MARRKANRQNEAANKPQSARHTTLSNSARGGARNTRNSQRGRGTSVTSTAATTRSQRSRGQSGTADRSGRGARFQEPGSQSGRGRKAQTTNHDGSRARTGVAQRKNNQQNNRRATARSHRMPSISPSISDSSNETTELDSSSEEDEDATPQHIREANEALRTSLLTSREYQMRALSRWAEEVGLEQKASASPDEMDWQSEGTVMVLTRDRRLSSMRRIVHTADGVVPGTYQAYQAMPYGASASGCAPGMMGLGGPCGPACNCSSREMSAWGHGARNGMPMPWGLQAHPDNLSRMQAMTSGVAPNYAMGNQQYAASPWSSLPYGRRNATAGDAPAQRPQAIPVLNHFNIPPAMHQQAPNGVAMVNPAAPNVWEIQPRAGLMRAVANVEDITTD